MTAAAAAAAAGEGAGAAGAAAAGHPPVPTLTAAAVQFVTERHLATLSSVRPDGSPHVVPVGFTWDADAGLVRVITSGTSRKARLAAAGGRVAVCQVDGRHWITLEGTVAVSDDPARVADAVARYARRYRVPRENPARVVLEITVGRVLGSSSMTSTPETPGTPSAPTSGTDQAVS